MATAHLPRRPAPRASSAAEVVREVFWVVALGLIACYAFFAALGAFSPGDVAGVTIAIAVLLGLWLVHAWSGRRRDDGHSDEDPRLRSARERRGF